MVSQQQTTRANVVIAKNNLTTIRAREKLKLNKYHTTALSLELLELLAVVSNLLFDKFVRTALALQWRLKSASVSKMRSGGIKSLSTTSTTWKNTEKTSETHKTILTCTAADAI